MSGTWVSVQKQQELQRSMDRLEVREEDLEESFIRSRGPGGQRVNKVATCVVLRHRPSGLEVRCQRERSQTLNRYWARVFLLERLTQLRREQREAEAQRLSKLRQQKRKRSKAVRERLIVEKRHRARKKLLRRIPRSVEE